MSKRRETVWFTRSLEEATEVLSTLDPGSRMEFRPARPPYKNLTPLYVVSKPRKTKPETATK